MLQNIILFPLFERWQTTAHPILFLSLGMRKQRRYRAVEGSQGWKCPSAASTQLYWIWCCHGTKGNNWGCKKPPHQIPPLPIADSSGTSSHPLHQHSSIRIRDKVIYPLSTSFMSCGKQTSRSASRAGPVSDKSLMGQIQTSKRLLLANSAGTKKGKKK